MSGYEAMIEEVRFAEDSPLEGGVRCELVSKVSFIRRSDEFLESIKKGIETSNPSLKPNSLLAGKIQGILLSRPSCGRLGARNSGAI
jgi:hypothetical protein